MPILEGDIFGSAIVLLFYLLLFVFLNYLSFLSFAVKIIIFLVFTFIILQKIGVIFGSSL
jgi:hypothetical protein